MLDSLSSMTEARVLVSVVLISSSDSKGMGSRLSDSYATVETNCSWRFVVRAGVEVFLLLKGEFLK